MSRLAKVKVVDLDGKKVFLHFYEDLSSIGAPRYSVEIRFGPEDRVVFDGPSISDLEATTRACLPATWASRQMLAGAALGQAH